MKYLYFARLQLAVREAEVFLVFIHVLVVRLLLVSEFSSCGDLAPKLPKTCVAQLVFRPATHLVRLAQQATSSARLRALTFVMHVGGLSSRGTAAHGVGCDA